MKKKYYSIRKLSEMMDVSAQTLRNWEKSGKLIPDYKTSSGYRYYSQEQVDAITGNKANLENKITIGYCRVSSSKQKDDLEKQVENVKAYLLAQGRPFEIIEDIGSSINYNKKGLLELLQKVIDHKVEKIVVLYKDRLLRFGYELFENIAKSYGVSIEVIDNTEKAEQQELVEDLVQIITVFSSKLQGKSATKAKEMIKELTKDDSEL
jgi:hypothetical protein